MIEKHPPNRPASSRWLNRGVLAIAAASFCSDISHETASTILPAFLATQLVGSPLALGLIEGIADALAAYFKLFGGWWTDRQGKRKPVAVAGYTITTIATASFSLATHWTMILGSRSLAWAARGMRGPARNALLADSVDRRDYGRAYGFERAADQAGAIVGPLLALGLMAWGVSHRQIFLLTAIPGAMAVAALWFFVRENPRPPRSSARLVADFRSLPRGFKLFLLVAGAFGLGQFAPTMLILRAIQILTPASGARSVTLAMGLYVAFNVTHTAAAYVAGQMSERVGSIRILGAAYLLFGFAAFGFGFEGLNLSSLVILFMLAGVAVGMIEAMEPAAAAELLPADLRGTGFGALGAANGVGDLLSSFALGSLWTIKGAMTGFCFASICNVASVVLLFSLYRRITASTSSGQI